MMVGVGLQYAALFGGLGGLLDRRDDLVLVEMGRCAEVNERRLQLHALEPLP